MAPTGPTNAETGLPQSYEAYLQFRIDAIFERNAEASAKADRAMAAIATHERECSERYYRLLSNMKWLIYAVVGFGLLTVLGGEETAKMLFHWAGLK